MKEKKEKEENKIYLIKGGKQVVSSWEFMQQTGTLDRMKQKGITINPTHSFELLKQTRQELFEKAKQNFSEERKMKKLATSDFEISCLYYSWLKGELNTIENWLSDTYPNGKKRLKPSTSDQIEILKYKQYVNNEMTQAENEISLPQPIVKQNDKLSDLIAHQKSIEIIDAIKIQYKNIRGKRLKLLLLVLQELDLLPKERIAKKFYNCCKAEFGWDVASYTAMNDYQFNDCTDEIELDNMKEFLEKIIQTK